MGPDHRHFLEDGADATFEQARVAILPVPHEATVSYGGGTACGPAALLEASVQLELYDEQLRSEPHRLGIWTAPPLAVGTDGVEASVAARAGELMDAGKWVVLLGGEHSVTPGAVAAAAARHPGLRVVQLDAHADLRESYLGRRDSHACAMARCLEHATVTALGVRSYGAAEAEALGRGIPGHRMLHAWEMRDASWIAPVLDDLEGRPVYLTVDLDYFDPSLMPATGTPEPGGPDWWTTLDFLQGLFRRTRVVACDVVELAPIRGVHHPQFTAARLVHKLIGMYGGGV